MTRAQATTDPLDLVLSDVKELISEAGVTYSEVERRAGFSARYLSKILNRHVDLKVKHILAILQAIDVPARELWGRLG